MKEILNDNTEIKEESAQSNNFYPVVVYKKKKKAIMYYIIDVLACAAVAMGVFAIFRTFTTMYAGSKLLGFIPLTSNAFANFTAVALTGAGVGLVLTAVARVIGKIASKFKKNKKNNKKTETIVDNTNVIEQKEQVEEQREIFGIDKSLLNIGDNKEKDDESTKIIGADVSDLIGDNQVELTDNSDDANDKKEDASVVEQTTETVKEKVEEKTETKSGLTDEQKAKAQATRAKNKEQTLTDAKNNQTYINGLLCDEESAGYKNLITLLTEKLKEEKEIKKFVNTVQNYEDKGTLIAKSKSQYKDIFREVSAYVADHKEIFKEETEDLNNNNI